MQKLFVVVAGAMAGVFAWLSAGYFSEGTARSVLPGMLFASLGLTCLAAIALRFARRSRRP